MDLHTRPGHSHESERGAVRVPVRPTSVAIVRDVVRRAARGEGLGPDKVDDVLVAVSEACTNAMEAQLRLGVTDPIEVRCLALGDAFAVEVRDHAGAGFDPNLLVPRPPITDPGHLDVERGWGVQLMQELVDRFEFDAMDDGSVVRLVLDLPER
jgi:serine/threonine-protein kinase RsbW